MPENSEEHILATLKHLNEAADAAEALETQNKHPERMDEDEVNRILELFEELNQMIENASSTS